MSRIGERPVAVPQNVKVNLTKDSVEIEGPKGKLQFPIYARIQVHLEDAKVKVTRVGNTKHERSLHGLTRAMIANMIQGVSAGFSKELEMIGVGYRAQLSGNKLMLQLGFSHPVEYIVPEGLTLEIPKPTQIIIKGIDKQKVGQSAANIRAFLPPEPYKGKGIRYVGEQVRRKAGKAMAK